MADGQRQSACTACQRAWADLGRQDTVHCDGAPVVDLTELNGVKFEPSEGVPEYDDQRVGRIDRLR